MRKFNFSALILFCGVILIFTALAYMAGAAAASTGSAPSGGIFDRLRSRSDDDLGLIRDALAMLEYGYYKDISAADRQELIYGAVEGMVAKLRNEPFKDNYSNFYPPEFYADLEAQTTGDYAGIGILMGLSADLSYPEVVTVFPGTPAEKAGILPDDLIVYIRGEEKSDEDEDAGNTYAMPLYEVASRIKGKAGTKVTIKIARAGQSELSELTLERADVHYSSIQNSELLKGNVGYIEITNFAEDTGKDFREQLEQLNSKAGGEVESLIIDLRNNSGGLLDAAVDVANCFIREGLIVAVNQRGERTEIHAEPESKDMKKYDLPVVVLINSNTASASEILAAALKDHGLATLVGETSFGKGVVQAVNPMEEVDHQVKSALAITIGEYFTKGGYEIHNKGIEPDVWFDMLTEIEGDERLGVSADPRLKGWMDSIEAKRKEIDAINTEMRRYLRDHDSQKDEGLKIATQLAAGQPVTKVPKPESREEEADPLLAFETPPVVDPGSANESTQEAPVEK